jgi:hypothetical protein
MGGTVPGLCEVWDVRYRDVISWLAASTLRQSQYERAIKARTDWAKEAIYNVLNKIVAFEITDVIDEFGRPLPRDQWPESARKAISKFRYEQKTSASGERQERLEVATYDKVAATKLLGSHFGMFVEKRQLEVGETLAELIMKSTQDPPEPEAED